MGGAWCCWVNDTVIDKSAGAADSWTLWPYVFNHLRLLLTRWRRWGGSVHILFTPPCAFSQPYCCTSLHPSFLWPLRPRADSDDGFLPSSYRSYLLSASVHPPRITCLWLCRGRVSRWTEPAGNKPNVLPCLGKQKETVVVKNRCMTGLVVRFTKEQLFTESFTKENHVSESKPVQFPSHLH